MRGNEIWYILCNKFFSLFFTEFKMRWKQFNFSMWCVLLISTLKFIIKGSRCVLQYQSLTSATKIFITMCCGIKFYLVSQKKKLFTVNMGLIAFVMNFLKDCVRIFNRDEHVNLHIYQHKWAIQYFCWYVNQSINFFYISVIKKSIKFLWFFYFILILWLI